MFIAGVWQVFIEGDAVKHIKYLARSLGDRNQVDGV